ncbi:glycoside hydrolase family 6 protein, partial [uncultured Nocardioides sp.]
NGNGATEIWCNPDGRALGKLPGFVDGGTGLDAYLWVKPPAESDGTCNEGPPAGEVYLDQAVELARAAGW